MGQAWQQNPALHNLSIIKPPFHSLTPNDHYDFCFFFDQNFLVKLSNFAKFEIFTAIRKNGKK